MSLCKSCGNGRFRRLPSGREFIALKSSTVPAGGWTQEHFESRNGSRLVLDCVNVKRFAQTRGMRVYSAFLRELFTKQITGVLAYADAHAHGGGEIKATGSEVFNLGGEEKLWASAIQHVLGPAADVEVLHKTAPIYQSVIDEVQGKTGKLVNGKPPKPGEMAGLKKSHKLAAQVTGINDETRRRLARKIKEVLKNDLTVPEMVKFLKKEFSTIAGNRIPTIARTEMGKAADAGAAAAYKSNPAITYVSVVGCQAIEPGIPTYHGIPTCNIQNVPVHDCDKLEFHINHTGCIVPSGFKDTSGQTEHVPTAEGSPDENQDLPTSLQDDEGNPNDALKPGPEVAPAVIPTHPPAPKPPKPVKPAPKPKPAPAAEPAHPVTNTPDFPAAADRFEKKKWLDTYWNPNSQGFTQKEIDSLKLYQGTVYAPINSYLRTGVEPKSPLIKNSIAEIDKVMAKSKTPNKFKCMRGVSGDAVKNLEAGKIYNQPAFTSTTAGLSGESFGDGSLMEIEIPKGTPAVYMNGLVEGMSHEVEILLARDTELEILSKVKEGDVWKIKARVVLKKK